MANLHFISTSPFYNDVLEYIYKLGEKQIHNFFYLDEIKFRNYRYNRRDNETEEKILSSLKNEGTEKTTITISHRLSSIQHAAKIIVLDNGKIAEMGTHSELFEKGGIYHEMYQQQLSK